MIAIVAYPAGRILSRISFSPLWAIVIFHPAIGVFQIHCLVVRVSSRLSNRGASCLLWRHTGDAKIVEREATAG
jgi:hypothetical protein